jgi:hypothetical protein
MTPAWESGHVIGIPAVGSTPSLEKADKIDVTSPDFSINEITGGEGLF